MKWVVERVDTDDGVIRPTIDQPDDDFYAAKVYLGTEVIGNVTVDLDLEDNGVYLLSVEYNDQYETSAPLNATWKVWRHEHGEQLFNSGDQVLERYMTWSNLFTTQKAAANVPLCEGAALVLSLSFHEYPQDIYWSFSFSDERLFDSEGDPLRSILSYGPATGQYYDLYANTVLNVTVALPGNFSVSNSVVEFSLLDVKRDGLQGTTAVLGTVVGRPSIGETATNLD